MKVTVTKHKLFGRRDIVRDTKHLAPAAARLVNQSVQGRMPRVEIVITTSRAMAELSIAADIALAGDVNRRVRARALAEEVRRARQSAGRTVVRPNGEVLVLLNAQQHWRAEHVATTLVHELTHAMQYGRPGVRDREIRHLRDVFGLKPQSRREDREHTRLLEAEEREAYAAEYLAAELIRDDQRAA